jgi:hypothetical protein
MDEVLAYAVLLQPEGFVIVAADSTVEPILAFSTKGRFDPRLANPLRSLLTADVKARLEHARTNTAAANRSRIRWATLPQKVADTDRRTQGSGLSLIDDVRVEPLIQTRWGVGALWNGVGYSAVYNYYTPPHVPGTWTNYPSGCGPTAWAQILRYHRYPTQPVGTNAFQVTVGGKPQTLRLRGGDGRGGPYDWNAMPLAPTGNSPEHERQAIGALTADLGVAQSLRYEPYGGIGGASVAVMTSVFHYANGISDEFGENFWGCAPQLTCTFASVNDPARACSGL